MENEKFTNEELQGMRIQYEKYTLLEDDTGYDPIVFFEKWFLAAKEAKVLEPNAMHLSTVGKDGKPSGRIVLLKGLEEGQFLFFTNTSSKKAGELKKNPFCALTFFWGELERQVRIEGQVRLLPRNYALDYFPKRPRISQLGAVASRQSRVVEDRKFLEKAMEEAERTYENQEIPPPEDWGGFAVLPHLMEFWQGRKGRLHDRIQFEKDKQNWKRYRLSP